MKASELREVYNARSVAEASLVAQALESDGIRTQLINAALQNAVGELPYLAVAPRVWVLAADYDRAVMLIDQNFRGAADASVPRTEWHCPRCEETNGPAFDVCWKCQYARPEPME